MPLSKPNADRKRVAGFRQAFGVMRPYRAVLCWALLIGICAAGISTIQPVFVSRVVDEFSGGITIGLPMLIVCLLIVGAGLTGMKELLIERAGERFAYDTRVALVEHIYNLPIPSLEKHDRADIVSRVTSDVTAARMLLTSGIIDLAVGGSTVIVSVVMMATIDPLLLSLALVAVLVVAIAVYKLGEKARPIGLSMQDSIGTLAGHLSRAIGSIKTIRAARATKAEGLRAQEQAGAVRRAGLEAANLRAIIQATTGVAVQLLIVVVVGIGALRVSVGAVSTGDLAAFIMYLMLIVTPITMMATIVSTLGEAFGALSRILELQREPIEDPGSDQEAAATDRPRPDSPALEFDNVSFAYSSTRASSQPVALTLDNVSFAAATSAVTALVGPSGAGKTTVFSLIERFYDVTEGTIRLHGRDMGSMSRDEVRSRVAYVDQDAAALSGTIRDNLRLNAPSADDETCAQALRKVALLAEHEQAREVLDRSVGELGSRLSGGERQRLAFARAILSQAEILLLDEVTSHLDGRNESAIQDVLRSGDGQTVLVIAHRLSTIADADRIILFDEGRIRDAGTHRELLERSELYRSLARTQFITSDPD